MSSNLRCIALLKVWWSVANLAFCKFFFLNEAETLVSGNRVRLVTLPNICHNILTIWNGLNGHLFIIYLYNSLTLTTSCIRRHQHIPSFILVSHIQQTPASSICHKYLLAFLAKELIRKRPAICCAQTVHLKVLGVFVSITSLLTRLNPNHVHRKNVEWIRRTFKELILHLLYEAFLE